MKNYHWDAVSRPPPAITNVYVKPARKDGKHMTTICYRPKKLRKLYTDAQIQERFGNDDSYRIINS